MRCSLMSLVCLVLCWSGCSAGPESLGTFNPDEGSGGAAGDLTSTCTPGAQVACVDNVATPCDGTAVSDCTASGLTCVPDLGCTACTPRITQCTEGVSYRCDATGTWQATEECENGCGTNGFCQRTPCELAAGSDSYIGCDYWPVPTANAQLDEAFEFAVVVANPQDEVAEVTVTRGASSVASASVPPGEVAVLPLPWIDSLKGEFQSERSALVPNGAYHLVSTLPVTVYQFNPLEYEGTGCAFNVNDPLGNDCFSFSNDASLLLPSHVMTGNYIAMSRPSGQIEAGLGFNLLSIPGFVTLVAVDEQPVDVNITFTAAVSSSADGAVKAFARGETGSWTLQQGDVLQLMASAPSSCDEVSGASVNGNSLCEVGEEFDLSGSIIEATGKVGVFGGHSCAMVPYTVMACDHLEEMLFPLEAWGKKFVVSMSEQLRPGEPNLVRLVSSTDGTQISFEPSVHAPLTLNRGQVVEFEVTQDFLITASAPLSVGQFLVGQNYTGNSVGADAVGDPSFSLAIPSEQYRDDYTFLAPSTYEKNYVNVVAPQGATITLDGNAVSGFVPLPGTSFQVARVRISGGQHSMQGSAGFGIVVYGFGAYTSYMYPGGLDLQAINII